MSLPLAALHAALCAVYVYSVWFNVVFVSNGQGVLEYKGYGGKFKYLTFINLILQTLYFGYSVLNDLFGSNRRPWEDVSKRSGLQKIRDSVAASVVFPMGCFVVVTFWGLYAVDRELVYPKHLDKIVPMWLNHIMHTWVIVFLLLEKCFVYHHYPGRSKGLAGAVAFAAVYQAWIFWIAYRSNIWVYPILAVLDWPGKVGFLAGCWVFLIIIYLLGEWLTNKIWRPSEAVKVKKID